MAFRSTRVMRWLACYRGCVVGEVWREEMRREDARRKEVRSEGVRREARREATEGGGMVAEDFP